MRRRRWVTGWLGLALFACSADGPVRGPRRVELERCLIHNSARTRSVEAQCGRVQVPQNYDRPEGASVDLFVAVVPALAKTAAADPLVHLAGGPGMAATRDYANWGEGAFAQIRRARDIVLVDQRGTGRSSPLRCADVDEIDANLSLDALTAAAKKCLREISVDTRYYTTTVAVRDLDAVRDALGYPTVNVYGISYGTRVALHYARRYPERVRTMILDGVLPPEHALGADAAFAAQRALGQIFARCTRSRDCQARFPALPSEFRRLSRRLHKKPVPVAFAHPRDGTPQTLTLTDRHLAHVLRLSSYSSGTAALIPHLVHRAANDDLAPVAAQFTFFSELLSDDVSPGMHFSAVCTEDSPFMDARTIDREALEGTYLGARMIDELKAICSAWPRGEIDDDFKQPLVADMPALLLSGGADPVTPPAYAAQVAGKLSAAKHIVVTDHGHGVARLPCVRGIVARFVATATTADDDACLETLRPDPFFLSYGGPSP